MLKNCSKIFFFMFLAIAAWQDYQTREMDGWLLSAAAIAGIVVCIIGCFTHQRALCDIILSCGVGAGLLVLSRLTSGGIGEGDGWFFVISGLYLNTLENMWLFFSGIFICFLWSLPLAVKAMIEKGKGRNRQLPFLPFLLPLGVWLAIS